MQNQGMEYGFGPCLYKSSEDCTWELGIMLKSLVGDFIISDQGSIFKADLLIYKHTDYSKNFEKLSTLSLCNFKRKEKGIWERGILINEGRIGIMDQKGMFVLDCWDWRAINGFYLNVEGFLQPPPH